MSFIHKLAQRARVTGIVCTRAFLSQLAFGVSAIVRDEAGRVLLVRPRFGRTWGLPGGGVGAGEPPEWAILRELREEVGLAESGPPALLGLYTRRVAWATNVVALYDVPEARIDFRPNFEIRDIRWADPAAPPPGVLVGSARRLAELSGQIPRSAFW